MKISDIPKLILWRKITCCLIGHNIKIVDGEWGQIEVCARCTMARTSFIVSSKEDKDAISDRGDTPKSAGNME